MEMCHESGILCQMEGRGVRCLHIEEAGPMLTIKGIYDGDKIKPLEEIPYKDKRNVIITFLDEDARDDERAAREALAALRGCAKGERLTEKLLAARREDLRLDTRK